MAAFEKRVKTGIPGFDALVSGGFLRGSVNLVSGWTGTGKTTFGLQFLWNGLSQFNEPGIFISTEESIDDLRKDALAFGWNFEKYEKEGKFAFYHFPPYDAKGFSGNMKKAIETIGARRVVIDSMSVFGLMFKDHFEARRLVFELSKLVKEMNCVCLSISEIPSDGIAGSRITKLSRLGLDEFVADSVILLHKESKLDKVLRVIKMRRTSHKTGAVPFRIHEKGFSILKTDSFK